MDFGSLNALWTLAPVAIICGAVALWKFQIAREGRRRPFEGKLLRPPGEFLRCRLEELDERLMSHLFFMILLASLLPMTIARWPARDSLFVQGAAMLPVVLLLAAVGWLLIRFLRLASQRRNYRLGFSGERLVGETLNQLMRDGCHVFHDLQTGEIGNLDHIVVSPAGVFLVETKTRRKKRKSSAETDCKVTYDGRRLQFPDGTDEEKLSQTKRNADWLGKYLTAATGEPVKVKPVLTLPGWWVERKAWNGVAVLNQKEIRTHVLHRDGPALPEAQQHRILHQLDQKCRDVEF